MMMARRMLRGVPLAQSSSSSSLPLLSLPLVLSLRAFVAAHTSPELHPSSYPCQSSRCSASTTPFGSELSRWQSTIHSAPCTRQSALRHSSPMSRVPKTPGFTTDAAAPAADVTPEDVLRYWFKDADLANNKFPLKFWFFGGEAVDTEIQEKFGECLERATRGELDNWKSTPHGRVALVLVFDQFSRNCHRDSSRGFAQDEVALQIALDSIHQDARVAPAADMPSIKSIHELKDRLSIGSLFKMKREWLARELSKGKDGGKGEPSPARHERRLLQIVVRRDQVFQDSYLQFASLSDDDLRNPLSVHFVGEVGRDDGGVTRDWYSVLAKEIFNPQYALFTHSAVDDYTFQINPNSGVNPDHLDFFRYIGTIVGKALYDGCLFDAHFTRLVYKRILDKPVTYHDMASVDVQFYKSLCWLLENKLDGMDLGLTFSVDTDNFGAYEEIELKKGGKDLVVIEQNKREYVDLLASWRLRESVEQQFQALRTGLSRVVDPVLLQHFDEAELEWLIGGLPTIDAGDWRKNTVYKAGFSDSPDCLVIRWFWQLVESWDQEMRARLLQFVTGTSKVPYPEGFKGLRGSEGLRMFHIVRVSDSTRLPQAHTCFNELILPDYDSYEELHKNLITAIFETGNQFQLR